MPQMGPLPWVMIWLVVLSLVIVLVVLIYFPNFYSTNDKSMKECKVYNWKW